MNQLLQKVIDILCDKSGGTLCVDDLTSRMDELRRQIIEILTDKRGELGIPKDKVDAIAEMILPDIVAFFQTEEGKRVFATWKMEQEKRNKEIRNGGENNE